MRLVFFNTVPSVVQISLPLLFSVNLYPMKCACQLGFSQHLGKINNHYFKTPTHILFGGGGDVPGCTCGSLKGFF